MDDLPIIARDRIQVVGEDESQATETEKRWYQIMRSDAPELATTKRLIGVCSIADVVSMTRDSVSVRFDNVVYTICKPTNGLRVARAREYSLTDALEELNAQRQIKVGMAPINKDFANIDAATIRGLSNVAESFFFKPFY